MDGRQSPLCTIDTNVDIVFVIDVTGSMQGTIDMVKESALSFHERLCDMLSNKGRIVKELRIKIIWFRDFYYDGEYAYGESEFFALPEEKESFYDFVNELEAKGGGDEPESALEALTLAMRSDFTESGDKRRHIIVLFTDASAHLFEDYDRLVEEAVKNGAKPGEYPENMPKDLSEFYSAWQGDTMNRDLLGNEGEPTKLDIQAQRMVLFAPNAAPWSDMEIDLENLIRKDIDPGEGCAELDMGEVYEMIVNSM